MDNGKSWGKPKLITNNVGAIKPIDCTPKGSLYYSTPGSTFDIYTVQINPETRIVNEPPVEIQLPNQGYNIHSAWSPDGSYIYFSKPDDPGWGLFRIPASGGEAIDHDAKMHSFGEISMHPDGQQITFSSFVGLQKLGEIWVMENFLPKE